jgi:hypothetical protein
MFLGSIQYKFSKKKQVKKVGREYIFQVFGVFDIRQFFWKFSLLLNEKARAQHKSYI